MIRWAQWRIMEEVTPRQKALDQCIKLQALSVGAGVQGNEGPNAAAMLALLMARHAITLEEIGAAELSGAEQLVQKRRARPGGRDFDRDWGYLRVEHYRNGVKALVRLRDPHHFEEPLIVSLFDRAVAAQQRSYMYFDGELATEAAWEQYSRVRLAESVGQGDVWINPDGKAVRIAEMSDRELAVEIDRLHETIRTAEARLAQSKEYATSRRWKPADKRGEEARELMQRDLDGARSRLRLFRDELSGR